MRKAMRNEYQKGFALTTRAELLGVIDGYRTRHLARDEIRVFAARLEKGAMHAESRVDVAHIVNKRTGIKGVRRLSQRDVAKAGDAVASFIARRQPSCEQAERPKAVSRRALQHIAQGRCTKVEAVVLLMYFAHRITQTKRLKRLEKGERYARFTFRKLEELSGIPKANLSRALSRLREKGLLGTVEVAKPNENHYGLLYVDGPLLSLVRRRQTAARTRRRKTTTPPQGSDNTPIEKTTTLRKDYPKRDMNKRRLRIQTRRRESHTSTSEWERIQLRARQMTEEFLEQAA